ncbi:hypothetical protein SJAV_23630 [Sulfurisphaera javensis]|uniref:Uncharacterized protein n=1 Tax=Sulfurisphaera javensis TaxID=2049879 RepID=A0AAT9GU73_9CREN
MIPHILSVFDINLPKDVNFWFLTHEDVIQIYSDALKTPEIKIKNDIDVKGHWLLKKGSNVIRVEDGENEIVYSNQSAYDFILVGEDIYTVEKKGKNFVFNGSKFLNYKHKYSFYVLDNKSNTVVITNGKLIELNKAIKYRINPNFINLIYDEYSLIIDNFGNKKEIKKPSFYLGKTSLGYIYQTLAGKITMESEYDLLGICSSDAYLIGESTSGIMIACGDKVKVYFRGGWSYLSSISNINASFANYNYVIITDNLTTVYNGELKKLYDLQNVHSIVADRKNIYVISNSRRIYILDQTEKEPIEILSSYNSLENSAIIKVNKKYLGEIKNDNKIIKIAEREEGDNVLLFIEPYRLTSVISSISIENELFKYSQNININSDKPEIKLVEGYIVKAVGGRIKGNTDFYNSIIKLKIKYNIPSRIKKILRLKIEGKEYTFEIENTNGEISINIPYVKFDSNEEIITLSIERNGFIELMNEYVLPIKQVEENPQYVSKEIIENASRKILQISEKDAFEWIRTFEYPSIYDNVIIAKEGSEINIEGINIKVKGGKQIISINKDNYKKEYIIYGLSYPIKEIYGNIIGNDLFIKIKYLYNLPTTIIYGTQIQTSTSGDFVFRLDPTYSNIYVRVYYSNDIKWEKTYMIENILEKSIINAFYIANKLKEELGNYGIM